MRKELEATIEALRAHAVRTHYYCEDTFYSCPKHPEGGGCGGNSGLIDRVTPDTCTCGADSSNEKLDILIANLIKEIG